MTPKASKAMAGSIYVLACFPSALDMRFCHLDLWHAPLMNMVTRAINERRVNPTRVFIGRSMYDQCYPGRNFLTECATALVQAVYRCPTTKYIEVAEGHLAAKALNMILRTDPRFDVMVVRAPEGFRGDGFEDVEELEYLLREVHFASRAMVHVEHMWANRAPTYWAKLDDKAAFEILLPFVNGELQRQPGPFRLARVRYVEDAIHAGIRTMRERDRMACEDVANLVG